MAAGSPYLARRRISWAIPSALCAMVNSATIFPAASDHAHRVGAAAQSIPVKNSASGSASDTVSPHGGSDDPARRPATGRSLTGALRRIPLLPVRSPARTGGGSVMVAVSQRPTRPSPRPSPSPNKGHPIGAPAKDGALVTGGQDIVAGDRNTGRPRDGCLLAWGVAGVVAQAAFMAGWLIADTWQGPRYSPVKDTISDLQAATAPHAWFPIACFAAGGLGTFGLRCVAGCARPWPGPGGPPGMRRGCWPAPRWPWAIPSR